jgi:elongation factor G
MSGTAEMIRNFVVAGHSAAGKTSLCDLMLFKAKAVERCGSVDQKTSVSDYTLEEQEKLSSIYATVLNCGWKGHKFYFVDTPGYGEFIGETVGAIHSSDAVMITVDGKNGLEVGASRAWKMAKEKGLPRFFFINRLDKEMADFERVLGQIQEAYGKTVCLPMTLPVGKEASFTKVFNVLNDKDIPQEALENAKLAKEKFMDAAAESDEELMSRYLDGGKLGDEEIVRGLRKAIMNGNLVPVFAGSTAKDIGVEQLMDAIISLFPNSLDAGVKKFTNAKELKLAADGPAYAYIFKTVADPFIGHLSFFRVVSGTFKTDSEIYNAEKREKERLISMIVTNGKNQSSISEAPPGTIFAAAKLKTTAICDTISSSPTENFFPKIIYPKPVMRYALAAAKSGEEEKISIAIGKICESDKTLKLERHPETHELLLCGMGEQHIAQVIKKIKTHNKLEVVLHPPKVPYKETVTTTGDGHYRHKKQTGGHGQFAEVYLKISPNPVGFEFKNDIFGGSIPRNFVPAVEKGVHEAMVKGPLAGCIVQNVTVSVYDGKHHDVDSSEMSFKIAARRAFKDAMSKAKPILLEPIQKVKVTVPDQHMGDVTGDLNHKRGRVLGINVEEGMQIISAEAPLSEMANYANELRSMTQGKGMFEMEFDRYEMVPSNVARSVIETYKASLTEED